MIIMIMIMIMIMIRIRIRIRIRIMIIIIINIYIAQIPCDIKLNHGHTPIVHTTDKIYWNMKGFPEVSEKIKENKGPVYYTAPLMC